MAPATPVRRRIHVKRQHPLPPHAGSRRALVRDDPPSGPGYIHLVDGNLVRAAIPAASESRRRPRLAAAGLCDVRCPTGGGCGDARGTNERIEG